MKTTVGQLRKVIREVTAPKKPDMFDVIDAIEQGLYDHEELKSINSYVQGAIKKKTTADEVQRHKGGLGDLESHRALLSDMMSDFWDDHQESAFVESLLALAGGQVYGPEQKDDDVSAAISAIIEEAGSASNDRDELESGNDEDPEYNEFEGSYQAHYESAMTLLEAFWKKYVAKKPAAKKPAVKKPAKKGR